jgi:hypothetical protein
MTTRDSLLPEADREWLARLVKDSDDRSAKRFDQLDRRLLSIDKRLDESDRRQRDLAEQQTRTERDSVVEGIEAERERAEMWARIGDIAGAKAGTAAGTKAGAEAGADAATAANKRWSAFAGAILAITSLINWWIAAHPSPPALPPHQDPREHVPTPAIGTP